MGSAQPSVLFPGAISQSPVVHVSSPDGRHGLAELVQGGPSAGAEPTWQTRWSPMPSPATSASLHASPRFEWEHDMTPTLALPSVAETREDLPTSTPRGAGRQLRTSRAFAIVAADAPSGPNTPQSPASPAYQREKTRLEHLRDFHAAEAQELQRLRALAAAEEERQAAQREAIARLRQGDDAEAITPLPGVRSEARLAPGYSGGPTRPGYTPSRARNAPDSLRQRLEETQRREDVLNILRQSRQQPPPTYRQY